MTAAVVTGIGVAAPNGLGKDKFWTATLRGESGIGTVRRFDVGRYPSRLGGEIGDFEPTDHLAGRLIPQTDRMTQLALAASDWALVDAGVQPGTYDTTEMGVATSGASGGLEYGQRELDNLWGAGPEHVSVYMSFAWFYAVNSGQISIRHGMRGPAGVMISDQAGGLDVLAQARRNIRKGARLILSGGVDSSFCPYGWVSRMSSGTLSTSGDPDRAYLPFDAGARGYVPGEGGAILVVEDADAARSRGARPYGEIAGYGATFDAAPRHGGAKGLRRAIEAALADAQLKPADIGVVFADGSGHARRRPRRGADHRRRVRPRRGPGHGAQDHDRPDELRRRPGRSGLRAAGAAGRNHPAHHQRAHHRARLRHRPGARRAPAVVAGSGAGAGPGPGRLQLSRRAPCHPGRLNTKQGELAMRQMTLHDLQDIMRECAGEDESAQSLEQAPDEDFIDLGYDSLALLETQARVKREYGVEFSEDDLADITTPREFVEFFNSLLLAA